ncbi:MAG: hypothetical protein WC234_02245 [Endomicrobiaceae bacterium]
MKQKIVFFLLILFCGNICAENYSAGIYISSDSVQISNDTEIHNYPDNEKTGQSVPKDISGSSTDTLNADVIYSSSVITEQGMAVSSESFPVHAYSNQSVIEKSTNTGTVFPAEITENNGVLFSTVTVSTSSGKQVSVSTTSFNEDELGTYYQSGAIIEEAKKETLYALSVPTTTSQNIAGKEALEKIEKIEDKDKIINSTSTPPKQTMGNVSKQQNTDDVNLPVSVLPSLPFQSQLLLSGRKLIGVDYAATLYDNEESGKRSNSSSFSMSQELQMKIKGKVGSKLELNVDFDDTQEDKKDISIVYKGDKDEFIQQAAFGDIDILLPSTEFSGYSKQLFGAKIDTKYKGLSTNAFFSKTKGYSESKQFKGNTKTEKKTIADTAYVQLKYYYMIKDSSKNIKQGTAKVYLDKGKVSASDYIVISTSTSLQYMKDLTYTAYNGNFIKLVAGTDYTIDYNTGVLTFKSTLSKQYVVAIDYQFTDGTWLSDSSTISSGSPQIIKDVNNTSSLSTELHTFYSLGNYQITKYNGRDNFILEVRDLNNSVPTIINPGSKSVPKFPNVEGYDANINVDFDNGIFNLEPINGLPMHDDLYTSATHRYNFVTEYQYKVKIFSLRSDIVPMSEKVVIDGKTLKINDDYTIDYDVGIVTVLKEDLIQESSVIDISYDYSPIGGTSAGSTLVGLRSEYNFSNNLSVGGSFIYEFSAQDTALPDLYNTPSSTFVGEVDTKIKDVEVADGLKMSVTAEYAKSQYIENTTGKAIVESMEGAKQEDSLTLIDDNWFYSSTPNSIGTGYDINALTWNNYDVEKKTIDPNLEIISGEKQQVMDLVYDLTACEHASIAQIVSSSGYDFSDKLYLEIWIKGDLNNTIVQLDYASNINEDSDRDSVLDTEDTNGDGIISPWEDIGRNFQNKTSAYGVSKIGANNGKLDTEDINTNNILDKYESNMSSFILNSYADKTKTTWQKIQIPLDLTTDADKDLWRNTKIARITLSGDRQGTITIGKVSVVGNKWTEVQSNSLSDFEISSIGRDDPRYVSLLSNSDYQSLYDINSGTVRDEQSLDLSYDSSSSNDEFYAKTTYTSAINISNYENFKFFLYVSSSTAISSGNESDFIMMVGGDSDNYYQYTLPITEDLKGKWTLLSVKQTGYGATAEWDASDTHVTKIGSPSLQQVSFIQTGLKTKQADAGEIWVNEIHVKGAKSKDGNAWKVNMNLKWDGTGAVGPVTLDVNRKSIDQNFETFAPGTYGRDYLEDYAGVTFKGIDIDGIEVLPLKASLTKTKTITPLALENESDTVSVLDEGRIVSYTGKAETVLSAGTDLPKISLQYTRYVKDTENIERLEDAETVSANLVYLNPIDFDILPTSLTWDYKVKNSYYKVYPDEPIQDSNTFLDLDTFRKYMDIDDFLTLEKTETWGFKTPFKILDTIIFSPGYTLTRVNEKNKEDFENQEINYDKSLNQDIGASLNFQVSKWFQPSVVYNVNTKETYDLNYSSDTANIIYPGQKKYIERTGTTEFTWNLQAKDILDSKYLKSLTFTTSYRMQDSDAYSNVEKSFSSIGFAVDKLWIRGNLMKDILPSYSTSTYTVKSVVQRDDRRIIGRYNPFETFNLQGAFFPIKTMTVSFTFTEGEQESYTTGTYADTYTRTWPDILIGFSRLERIFDTKFISDTQLNLKHNKKTSTTSNVSYEDSIMYGGDYKFKILKKFDVLFEADITTTEETDLAKRVQIGEGETFEWAMQGAVDIKQWRMSLRYENSQQWEKNSTGNLSSQIFANDITGQITSDLLFPSGMKIPFFGMIPLKNRIIFDSSIFYKTQSSAVNVEDNNLQNYGLKLSADYEISKNFRFTLGAGWSRYVYTYVPDENYTLVELASKLTVQF